MSFAYQISTYLNLSNPSLLLYSIMEAAGIVALVRAATSATLQARTLCAVWKDAPRDILYLRDELETCKVFFDCIENGILELSFLGESSDGHGGPKSGTETQRETLTVLLSRGAGIVQRISEILVGLIGEPADNTRRAGNEVDNNYRGRGEPQLQLALRKKLLWLRRAENVTKLRKLLRRTTDDIGLCLTILNM